MNSRDPDLTSSARPPVFSTTHWTVVLAAGGDPGEDKSRRALETFFEGYWTPLYVFARRQGCGAEAAQDSVQAFFLHVLKTRALASADREIGRFRTFLLRCFRNFLANERKEEGALKRGGEFRFVPLVELDTEELDRQVQTQSWSPECAFDIGWAFSVVDRVLRELRAEAGRRGKEHWFNELQRFLPHRLAAGPPPDTDEAENYQQAAGRLGLSGEALRTAVHRLRARFRELLRAEVAATVETVAEIDAEMRHLRATLSLAYRHHG